MSEPTEQEVREEVRAWLADNWDPNLGLVEWRNKLVDSGWGAPTFPVDWYGKGYADPLGRAIDEEFEKVGAVGVARVGIRNLAGKTLLRHGTDLQKETFLRRILTGEDGWCQLFSEPGSGSDLAGASTRADLKGNKWVVNGQKVWTSSAHHAQWALLLARTDWDVPKHKGLTFFIINMEQPGVTVRQLQQMNGHASFNEVFFTDAVVEPEMQVSDLGNGWNVATTTLMHERRDADGLAKQVYKTDKPGRCYAEEAAEIEVQLAPYVWYPQRRGRIDLILPRARETGKINDPAVRQEIARLFTLDRSAEFMARRARASQDSGKPQGPEGSLGKLCTTRRARMCATVHTMISATDVMLTGEDSPMDGMIAEIFVSTPAQSIAGGTDEIQRNIISERVLHMPKEARTDTAGPFRDVKRNIGT
jgi:alkylation response protein AidB-like acyl-CoA dehydrogenase